MPSQSRDKRYARAMSGSYRCSLPQLRGERNGHFGSFAPIDTLRTNGRSRVSRGKGDGVTNAIDFESIGPIRGK